jgi:Na+/proline symporter
MRNSAIISRRDEMIIKGKAVLRIVLAGAVAWIALNRLAAYYGLSYLFWAVFGIVAFLAAAAFFWPFRIRREPDPGEEEKLAA